MITEAARLTALLDERSAMLARRGLNAARARAVRDYLVCTCGAERYGMPLVEVAGVAAAKPCTPLPGAPSALMGIVALSGRIVSVIDLGEALGLPRTETAPPHGHLVRLRGKAVPIALAVERVTGIARIAEDSAESGRDGAPPDLGTAAVSGYAPPGSDEAGGLAEGFAILDLPRLLRTFLP